MKRGVLIGICAGALVLILIWYFALFSPTSSDLQHTRDEVAAAQRDKQELENTIRRLTALSKNATQQAATLNSLKAAIPPNPDLGGFILQANEIASTAGIDFLSIAPTPPAASVGGQNSTIALSIQVDGGFFQVLDYLNRLEDMQRLVIVDTISVSATTGSSSTGSTGGTGSSAGGTSADESTDVTGAPDLSVTLTGRMFTTAEAAPATGSSGTTGGSTTPTTPTTPGSGTTGGTTDGTTGTVPSTSGGSTSTNPPDESNNPPSASTGAT